MTPTPEQEQASLIDALRVTRDGLRRELERAQSSTIFYFCCFAITFASLVVGVWW